MFGDHIYVEELAADAAVYFLISLLVVAQTVLYASFDVIGGEEDNAAFVLQPVINADEVAENGVSQFVALVEDDERGVEEGDEGDSVVQRVSQISPIGGGTHTKSLFFMSSLQRR